MAQPGGQSPRLTGLALELISRILDYIDPLSQFNVALTCRHLAYKTGNHLRRHQQLHKEYAVSSDLDPSTVPTLLRSVLGISDPLMAWHVRTFEIWGLRDSWADWKTFTPESDVLIPADGEPISWDFTTEDRLLIYDQFSLPGDDFTEEVLKELDKGRDSAIKILLVKLLPRLNDLKFVRTPGLPHQVTAFDWLCRIFFYGKPDVASSPGLASVRSLAVNVPGGPSSAYSAADAETFAWDLLVLPSLHDIYIADLDTAGGMSSVPWHADHDRSSVEHIFIDGAYNFFSMDFIGRIPRGLRSLAIRGRPRLEDDEDGLHEGVPGEDGHIPHQGVDELVHSMCRRQRTSMESLMLYNSNLLHRKRGLLYDRRSLEWLEDGPLRQLAIHWADVNRHVESRCSLNQDLDEEDTFVESFRTAVPATIEGIVILGDAAGVVRLGWLKRALIELIDFGDHEHLKVIYLEEPPSCLASADGEMLLKKAWLEDLVALGRKKGIDVRTGANRDQPRHEVHFPVARDKHDLASGPWYVPNRENDDNWEVDVYAGVWRRREAVVQQG